MNSELPTSIPGLREFADDEARVADVFETAFLPNTDGVKKLEGWLEEDFEVEVVARMAQSFPRDRKLRLLGVGAGDGTLDLVMLERFLRHFNSIHYTVVEPDVNAFEQCRQNVKKYEDNNEIEFEWHNMTIEEYTMQLKDSSRFDFISVIHTAYYLEDLGKTMDILLASLTEGGQICLAHKSADNQTVEFARRLPWFTNHSHLSPGARIRDAARRCSKRLRTFPFPAVIDVTSVFDIESDIGPKLLDFLTQGAFFCQTAPVDVVAATVDLLRSLTTKSNDDDDDGRVLIRNDFEIIIILN